MDPEGDKSHAKQWQAQALEYYEQYSRFSLKYQKHETAEYYLR